MTWLINEELLERNLATPVWKPKNNDRRGSAALTTRHPSIHKKLALNFVDKWQLLSWYSSLVD
jgi:hypothetical protein